ncbi:MAG: hypothetical protein V1664_01865 [Candidatus Uhrbacteria bacterium]
MLIIPKSPNFLRLSIGRLWNGGRCPDSRLSALVELQKIETGVEIITTVVLPTHLLAEAAAGARLENIDSLERLCLFFVEDGGQYLEVELGAGGQYLVLGFDAPHQKVADFAEVKFTVEHEVNNRGKIKNKILIPQDFFPANLVALNAFLVAGNQTLAYYPLPGNEPDLHQPAVFPLAKLEA